jgi:hypothetical protein
VKPNQAARFAAIVLALAGVAALLASVLVALGSFQVVAGVPSRRYDCGSVLFAKDPRTLVPKAAQIPARFKVAENRCEKQSTSRTHKALTFMIAGAIPLLIVLALPAISRRSRRARRRRAR